MKMEQIKYLIVAMFMASGIISSAQDKSKNPYGLVYRDAITENLKGQVNIHPVRYKLNGNDIAANVYGLVVLLIPATLILLYYSLFFSKKEIASS